MNILPFVITLLLILSVITIEKLEKFKNREVVKKEYQSFIEGSERFAINDRQEKLCDKKKTSKKQLSFRYFLVKGERKNGNEEESRQLRLITIEFLKVLYGKATFYKEMEQKRPNFLDDLLDGLIASTDRLTDKDKLRRVEDMSRLKLDDPELQDVLYKMLKGTVKKEDTKEKFVLKNEGTSYLSLLDYIHFEKSKIITIRFASRELLEAIFGSSEIADQIIVMRKELCAVKNHPESNLFAQKFKGKQINGISDDILDFEIGYNKDIDNYD
jgi:hypothetical protein